MKFFVLWHVLSIKLYYSTYSFHHMFADELFHDITQLCYFLVSSFLSVHCSEILICDILSGFSFTEHTFLEQMLINNPLNTINFVI